MHKMLSLGLLSLSLFACGEKTEDTAGSGDVVSGEADLVNGEAVHDSNCMPCHAGNPDMETNTPSLSDSELESVIQNGSGAMPGQGLSETDLRDVIAYLRQEYGG